MFIKLKETSLKIYNLKSKLSENCSFSSLLSDKIKDFEIYIGRIFISDQETLFEEEEEKEKLLFITEGMLTEHYENFHSML